MSREQNNVAGDYWQEVVDDSTGNTYYHNSLTGDTQWERPAEFNQAQVQEDYVDVQVDDEHVIVQPTAPTESENQQPSATAADEEVVEEEADEDERNDSNETGDANSTVPVDILPSHLEMKKMEHEMEMLKLKQKHELEMAKLRLDHEFRMKE